MEVNVDGSQNNAGIIQPNRTVRDMAKRLGIAIGRCYNILSKVYGYSKNRLTPETMVSIDKYAEIVNYRPSPSSHEQKIAMEGLSSGHYEAATVNNLYQFGMAYDNQTPIRAKIKRINGGGYILSVTGCDDINIFCPFSKAPTYIDEKFQSLEIGEDWLVSIDSYDRANRSAIVSARLFDNTTYERFVDVDDFYEAIVCSINDNGANLLLDYIIPIFLPNSYVGWTEKETAIKSLELGQKVAVKLKRNDKGLYASMRDAILNPWSCVKTRFKLNCVYDADINEKHENGIDVTLGEYSGFIPSREISWTENIVDCSLLEISGTVRAVVTDYDFQQKKIMLSLRKIIPNPWENLDKYIPENGIMNAKICKLNSSGAILKVGEIGFKGYLSYREVDWGRSIDKNNFPHQMGDNIRVKITRRNKERKTLTCSIKALESNPWESLDHIDKIDGLVIKVNANNAEVLLQNGIECVCNEVLTPDLEGKTINFDILQSDSASQKIIISYRKHEIADLNTLAMGDMFKSYHNIATEDKKLTDISEEKIYRHFVIKEVGPTGRAIAEYAEDDNEYKLGILLPEAVKIGEYPVNVIFARYIVKTFLKPGLRIEFCVKYSYNQLGYAVLAIDAAELIHLNDISTDDLSLLSSQKGVEATVLADISTDRNVFLTWHGYFGYIPKSEISCLNDDMPESIYVRACTQPQHPGQIVRFLINEQGPETEEQVTLNDEVLTGLDDDLRDCYKKVTSLREFNIEKPNEYPCNIQLRYNPIRHENLAKTLANNPNYFASQSFNLDCYSNKKENGPYILKIFNKDIFITSICKEKGDEYEIEITKCILNATELTEKDNVYKFPLKVAGENLKFVEINSSVPNRTQLEDIENMLSMLKYYRDVVPELKKLKRVFLKQQGETYLTLKELLEMDKKREEVLCGKEIRLTPNDIDINEVGGTLGGNGIEFKANDSAFDEILSSDDSQDGIQVLMKADDGEAFKNQPPTGKLKFLGSQLWVVELYPNRPIEIEQLKTNGILIKRFPNIKHLDKQIKAINNYVYGYNGLDIFGKIKNNKLKPITLPSADSIEANQFIKLEDPNDSQANALKMALGGSELTLIQGPPGTGKSTVIIDIIRNLVKRQKKVLVCTQSVAPIEELYYKLSGRRNGKQLNDPVQVDGKPLVCAYLRDDDSIEKSGSVEERRNAIQDMMLNIRKLNDGDKSAENNNSDNAKRTKFAEDILPYKSEVLEILRDYKAALDRPDVQEFASAHQTMNLDAVDVVFGTCIGVGVNSLLWDKHFDTLIIDEAGKANYAETLVPMMMADEYILVGDDCQLPPFTNSSLIKKLAKERLSNSSQTGKEIDDDDPSLQEKISDIMKDVDKSLFGELRPQLPKENVTLLSKQFRMHPEIGEFVSKLFYGGKISSMPKPEERQLNIEGLERPIMFIDTSKMGSDAKESSQGTSLYNDGEIQVIEDRLLSKLESALSAGKTVGILSPYGAQVMKMRKRFPKLSKHIFTIDSIQGEEYDVVVFSFVRNTKKGKLTFIDDLRRLNVSFSRAKCNLIMVGHLDTLMNEKVHDVDHTTVMNVYNEINNQKVLHILPEGAMQIFEKDYIPGECPIRKNIDQPYIVLNDCKPIGKGKFTCKYKGQLLTLYNPTLEVIKDNLPQKLNVRLMGFNCKTNASGELSYTPYTIFEPIGLYLENVLRVEEFEFSAQIHSSSDKNTVLKLTDGSLISLPVPSIYQIEPDTNVKIAVKNKKVFTITKIYNNE